MGFLAVPSPENRKWGKRGVAVGRPPLAFPHSLWPLKWGQKISFPACADMRPTLRRCLLSHAWMVVASVAVAGLCATTAHPCRCQPLTGCSLLCPGTLVSPVAYDVVCMHVVSSLLLGWCRWTLLVPLLPCVCGLQSAHARACVLRDSLTAGSMT